MQNIVRFGCFGTKNTGWRCAGVPSAHKKTAADSGGLGSIIGLGAMILWARSKVEERGDEVGEVDHAGFVRVTPIL